MQPTPAHSLRPSARRLVKSGAPSALSAFTLVELVVVVVILATLALIVVPRVGKTEEESRIVVAATNLTELERGMGTSFAVNERAYPTKWDSLLDATNPAQIYGRIVDITPRNGVAGPWLASTMLTNNQLQSLLRVSGGAEVEYLVYDHDASIADANASTDEDPGRALAIGEHCAIVSPTGNGLFVYDEFDVEPMVGRTLIAFGIGPRCTLVGSPRGVLFEAPMCAPLDRDQSDSYLRYVAVYLLPPAGAPAEFLGCVTAQGYRARSLRNFMSQ